MEKIVKITKDHGHRLVSVSSGSIDFYGLTVTDGRENMFVEAVGDMAREFKLCAPKSDYLYAASMRCDVNEFDRKDGTKGISNNIRLLSLNPICKYEK